MKVTTKMIVAAGLFLGFTSTSMPLMAAEQNTPLIQTNQKSVYQATYKDKSSVQQILEKHYGFSAEDLTLISANQNSFVYDTKGYQVQVDGLDMKNVSKQEVTLTLKRKTGRESYPFELPVTAIAQWEKAVPNEQVETVQVNVKDNVAPTIEGQTEYTIEEGQELDVLSNLKAQDEAGETTLSLEGSFDPNTAGTYALKAVAKDVSGNKATKDITVQVQTDFYQRIADAALAQLGRYQDCTMLVTNSLKAVGIDFHGAPAAYLSLGQITNDPVPGDIIVYSGHVAIYIGNGQAVHGGWMGNQTVVSTVSCTNPFIAYVHVSR